MNFYKITKLVKPFIVIVVLCLFLQRSTIAAEGPMLVVTAPQAEIKVTEEGVSRILRTVNKGTQLWSFDTKGDWYEVMDPKTQEHGWISSSLVRPVQLSDAELQKMNVSSQAYSNAMKFYSNQDYKKAIEQGLKALTLVKEVRGKYHPDTATVMTFSGVASHYMKDFKTAGPYYEESLAIRRQVLGNEHPETISSLNNLMSLYKSLQNYSKAEPLLREIVALNRKTQGVEHPDTVKALHDLGQVYSAQGKYKQAAPLVRQCLEIVSGKIGESHSETTVIRNNLGMIYNLMGDYPKAEKLLLKNLEVRRKTLDKMHPDMGYALNNLGNFYFTTYSYSKALPLFIEALEITRKSKGEEHPNTATALNNLAGVYLQLGDFKQAEQLYQQVLAIQQKVYGKQHSSIALTLSDLGSLYQDIGEYSKAESTLLQSLEICRRTLGNQHPGTAEVLNKLGYLYRSLSEYSKAEPLFLQCLKIYRATLGENHIRTASVMGNLGSLYRSMGNYLKAASYLYQSFEIYRKVLGTDNEATAQAANSLAAFYEELGDDSLAEKFAKRSLEISTRALGTSHHKNATLLDNLGKLKQKAGKYSDAEELLKKGLRISKSTLGEKHPDTATHMANLGSLYQLMDKRADAELLYQESFEILNANLDPGNPEIAHVLAQLSSLSVTSGDLSKATSYLDKSRRSVRLHMSNVLPGLSEKTQLSYIATRYYPYFSEALSLGLKEASNPKTVKLSADWLLNGKAVAHEVLAEAATLSTQQTAPLVFKLRAVRDELSELSLHTNEKHSAKIQARMKVLEAKKQNYEKQIAKLGVEGNKIAPWLTTETLREKLPPRSALVNIISFQVVDFEIPAGKGRWQPARYVAWLIPAKKSGKIQIIDLGEAEPIDQKVKALRNQIQQAVKLIPSEGEKSVTTDLRKHMAELSQQLFGPLESSLEDVDELILSPDGELWTVPWSTLMTKDDSYLIEKYRMRFVVSGRELLRDKPVRSGVTAPVVFADPKFSMSAKLTSRKTSNDFYQLRFASSAQFPPLAASASEAASIKPSLENYVHQNAKMFLQDDAQEAAFKNLHRPRVLVMSTHGYFEKQPDRKQEKKPGMVFDNPMLRCGLALAGCNNRVEAVKLNKEDGILTGMEIVGTDLRGTELVVLSACETGLGDIRTGEGVAGLRQAFQLAGAESIVSSLWQVEDNETAKLMDLFFKNLAAGKNKAEALRQAQLTRIKIRRERNGGAHPFFWAAFTLTGQE